MKREKGRLPGLFISFFRISALTLGGGAVMLPLMEDEFVSKRGWLSEEDMIDVYTICNTLPGVIAVNSSLTIGKMTAGLPGAACAVLGVLLPSVSIIMVLASAIGAVSRYAAAADAFSGIRAGVAAMLIMVVIKLGRSSLKGRREAAIAVFAFLALEVLGLNAVVVVLLSAAAGWLLFGPVSRRFGDSRDRSTGG